MMSEDGDVVVIEPKEEPASDNWDSSSDMGFEEVTIEGASNAEEAPEARGYRTVSAAGYMCQTCNYDFSSYGSLRRHFNSIHGQSAQKVPVPQRRSRNILEKLQERALGYSQRHDGKFGCNYCDYKTVLKETAASHVARLHKNHGQSVAVRTPSITLAIEPLGKVRSKEAAEEAQPIDDGSGDMPGNLVEGDAEMVREADQLLADDDMDGELIDEDDDDYVVEAYETEQTEEYATEDSESVVEYVEDSQDCSTIHEEEPSEVEQEAEDALLVTYTCPYCEYATTDKSAIHQHITSSHEDVLSRKLQRKRDRLAGFDCPKCDFVARTRTMLYDHARANHPGNVQPAKFRKPQEDVKCDQCDFVTSDRRKMIMHIDRKHTTEYRFTCEFCGKKFKVKCDLTSHIRFQHFRVPLVCDVCGKVCSNSNSLHVHQKREHFKPEFECQICHRRMVSQENLQEHIYRQHEQPTTFMCEQCGKVFDQASKLRQHKMTHTGERPHTCHLCGKAFARRAVFRQHLLIHTGEKPYVCDICGKSFTQKPGLICHRKMHPGDKPPLPVVYIDHILKKVAKKEN